jgi:hypothetical protein
MKNISFFILSAITFSALLSGCGSIYSPTLNLPHEPLHKNEGQITGSIGALPQQGEGTLGFAGCGEGQISYGFSDRFSITGKAWSQASELYQMNYNGGTSLSASYLINSRDDKFPMALIATTSMLIEGRDIKANGGSVHLAAWLPEIGIFRPYAALGAGLLAVNFKTQDWGYGGIVNAGTSIKLSDYIRINFEVFGIVQDYIRYHRIAGYLAPSVGLSWHFDNN